MKRDEKKVEQSGKNITFSLTREEVIEALKNYIEERGEAVHEGTVSISNKPKGKNKETPCAHYIHLTVKETT